MVAHAVLDEAMELLLRAAFSKSEAIMKASVSPLLAVNGPLATFWSKLHLANSLGLLSSTVFSDLDIIRRIQSRFAHQKAPVNFDDKSLASDIEKLSTTEHYGRLMKGKRYALKPDSSGNFPSVAQLQEEGILSFRKTCFTWSVGINLTFLEICTKSVDQGRIISGRAWAKNGKRNKCGSNCHRKIRKHRTSLSNVDV